MTRISFEGHAHTLTKVWAEDETGRYVVAEVTPSRAAALKRFLVGLVPDAVSGQQVFTLTSRQMERFECEINRTR